MAVDFDPHPNGKRSRTRSPAYPYIALPNALEKAAVLWQVEGRHAAAVNVAMQHWGYKEDSSTGYSCVAALKKFGLVDHEGMGDTRQVKLSDRALAILLDKDPDSDGRRDALRAAALGPRIHAELWERYGTELPSDQSLKRYLVLERGFNEAAVDELLDEYKQTMTFAGLNVATGAAGTNAAALPPPLRATPAVAPEIRPVGTAAASAGDEPPPTALRQETTMNARQDVSRSAHDVGGSRPVLPPSRPAGEVPRRGGQVAARQAGLFGEDEDDGPEADERFPATPVLSPRPEAGRGGAPWSMARKELPVPLDHDLVARVPYPMTEEDFDLLIDTLQLWKKRLVQPGT